MVAQPSKGDGQIVAMKTLDEILAQFNRNPGATDAAIGDCESALSVELPSDFKRFLKLSNGGEGPIGTSSYLQLWRVEQIPSRNDDYGVAEFAPGIVIFGSDGGSEAYAFDYRRSEAQVISIPFHLELQYARCLSRTFDGFLADLQ